MEFDNDLNEKISFDEFMKNGGASDFLSDGMKNILQHLNESAEEAMIKQHKDIRTIRVSFQGVLEGILVEKISDYLHNREDFGHLNAIKLILEVLQLLRKENEWNGE